MDGGVAILDVDWLDGRRHAVYCEVVCGQNNIMSEVLKSQNMLGESQS